jgi:hypothetical protein
MFLENEVSIHHASLDAFDPPPPLEEVDENEAE